MDNLLNKDDYCHEYMDDDVDEIVKDKEICHISIKPKTDVGIFWLKDASGFELDFNPKSKERKPNIKLYPADEPKPFRSFIGKLV